MLGITWGQYWMNAGGILMVYYAAVGLLCYRSELERLIRGSAAVGTNEVEQSGTVSAGESIDGLEPVVADLKGILVKAGNGVGKQQLLRALKQRLASYAGLQHPAFRVAINNYIIRQGKDFCGVDFSEAELDKEWGSLPR